jgi:hypothetical protein
LFFLTLLTQSLIDNPPEHVGSPSPSLHTKVVASLHPWISLMQSLWDSPNEGKTFLVTIYGVQRRSPLIGAMTDGNNDPFIFHIVSICQQIRDLNAAMTRNAT